jgi:hypothetical protein
MRPWQRIILASVLCATVPSVCPAGEAGSAGALFLRVGVGARPAGMGEAFTAVAADASSLYWNPAAMAPVLGTNLLLEHNEFLQSLRFEQIMLTHETSWGTIGLGFTGRYGDEMDRREDIPTATPLGTFTAYDVAFMASYARYIVPNTAVGLTAKPIYLRIDDVESVGIGFDLGVFHVSRIKGVNLAFVLGNVGPPMKFEQEEFALPRFIKVGASYTRDIDAISGGVLGTIDGVFPNDGDARVHLGVEGNYQKRFFVRTGYKAGYDTQGLTAGVGVGARRFEVDYAFSEMANDLGDGHRISLNLSF